MDNYTLRGWLGAGMLLVIVAIVLGIAIFFPYGIPIPFM